MTLAEPSLYFALASKTVKGRGTVDATDGTGTATVTIHVHSDKRKPYESRTNRFEFDPASPMVELIYTDNTAGAFVAHGSGWGQAVPVDVFLCRCARINIQVVDADTGEEVNAAGFGYEVSEIRINTARGRSTWTEVVCYRGTSKDSRAGNGNKTPTEMEMEAATDMEAAAAYTKAVATDNGSSAMERIGASYGLVRPDCPPDAFHGMYANAQGGEYAARVWCDERSMPEWSSTSLRQVRYVGGVASAGGGGSGDVIFVFEVRRKQAVRVKVCERHAPDVGIPGVRVSLSVVAPPRRLPAVPPPPPAAAADAALQGSSRRAAAFEAVEMWMASMVRALGVYVAELPSEDDRATEMEIETGEDGCACVMVPMGSGVAASAPNTAAMLVRSWFPPAPDVGGNDTTAEVFAARARACAAADAAVDLSDPDDPLVLAAAAASPAATAETVTLPMSLQRVCPVVIKVLDTNYDPAPGITVEVTLEALPETEEDDAVGKPPLPARLITAVTDDAGVIGADGFITAPVGAWLRARVVFAPHRYQDVYELPLSYCAHQERWTIREDITLAVQTPVVLDSSAETASMDPDADVDLGMAEGGSRTTATRTVMNFIRPTAAQLLCKAAEIAPVLMYPRKPWAVVRAVDAATGETVLGLPCAVTVVTSRVREVGATTQSEGGDLGGECGRTGLGTTEVELFSGVTGDAASRDVLYALPRGPGTTLMLSASPVEGGRFLAGAQNRGVYQGLRVTHEGRQREPRPSFAPIPLRVMREAPEWQPAHPVVALHLTMPLRRAVEGDQNVAFWLQRDALLPTFYAMATTAKNEAEGGRNSGGGGVVASRVQSHPLARLTPGARRGEVLAAPPAPPRALAAIAAATLLAATASVGGTPADPWAVAAADAVLRGILSRAGAVATIEQPPPPSELAHPKSALHQPSFETLSLEQKLKHWGAPYVHAGSAGAALLVVGDDDEKLPTAGSSQGAAFHRWTHFHGPEHVKILNLGFHPELPGRLMVLEAAYLNTAAACVAAAVQADKWNVGRGRRGQLAFGDGALAEAALAVAHHRAGSIEGGGEAWKGGGGFGFDAMVPSPATATGAESVVPFTPGFGGAFVILAVGLSEVQLAAAAEQLRDLLLFWSDQVVAANKSDDNGGGEGGGDLDDDDDVKMRFTVAYCPANPVDEQLLHETPVDEELLHETPVVELLTPLRMQRCRACAAEEAYQWLMHQISEDFRNSEPIRRSGKTWRAGGHGTRRREGALVPAVEAVCAVSGYSGEPLYVVCSNDTTTSQGDTSTAAAHVAERILAATSAGVDRALAKHRNNGRCEDGLYENGSRENSRYENGRHENGLYENRSGENALGNANDGCSGSGLGENNPSSVENGSEPGQNGAGLRPGHGDSDVGAQQGVSWDGQLSVPVHCVVLGNTPEAPPGWPLVRFPNAQGRHETGGDSDGDNTGAAEGETFVASAPVIAAATAGRLQWVDRDGMVAALQPLSTTALSATAVKYERQAAEARLLHDAYTATIHSAIRSRWGKVGTAGKVLDQFKWIPDSGLMAAAGEGIGDANGDANKTKTGKKSGKDSSKNWIGYSSSVYYKPRSQWPPLPREARRRAKERDEHYASANRFRPWDGDASPWSAPTWALNTPARDLTLVNQPPWRHNSPGGDPSIHLDRARPSDQQRQRQGQTHRGQSPRRPQSAAAFTPRGSRGRGSRDSWSPPRTRAPPPDEWTVSGGKAVRLGVPTMWEAQGGEGGGMGSVRIGSTTPAFDAMSARLGDDLGRPTPPPRAPPERGDEEQGGHATYRGFRRRGVL
jgi:hypothetical protein